MTTNSDVNRIAPSSSYRRVCVATEALWLLEEAALKRAVQPECASAQLPLAACGLQPQVRISLPSMKPYGS